MAPLAAADGTPAGLRDRLRRLSLRTRLTLLAAAAVAAAVAVVVVSAYVVVRGELRQQVDRSLVSQSQSLISQGRNGGPGLLARLLAPVQTGQLRFEPLFSSVILVRTDGTTSPLAGVPASATVVDGRPFTGVASGQVPQLLADARLSDGTLVRAIAIPVQNLDTQEQYALVLARSLAETNEALDRLRVLLLLAGGLGVLLAVGGGLLVARAGLRPVDRLTAAAEHVARTEELDAPIAVRGDDEVARLARSFNAMTAALSASRNRQRRLVADAGHELRTPLTSLRTNLELLVRSERSGRTLPAEDRERLLDDLGAQVTELGTLVGELTDLARDERATAEQEHVDFADVAARAVRRARRRAGNVVIEDDLAPWPVLGRPVELERAVLNLLDNAVKFSPPGSVVDVRLRDGELTVSDRGPGVEEEDRPHLFDRFYRAPAARGQPGSGLGLSIVAQAAAQHRGAIRLEGRPGGGTVARLWLPAAPSGATDLHPAGRVGAAARSTHVHGALGEAGH